MATRFNPTPLRASGTIPTPSYAPAPRTLPGQKIYNPYGYVIPRPIPQVRISPVQQALNALRGVQPSPVMQQNMPYQYPTAPIMNRMMQPIPVRNAPVPNLDYQYQSDALAKEIEQGRKQGKKYDVTPANKILRDIGPLEAGIIPYVKETAGLFTRPFGIEPMDQYTQAELLKARAKHPVASGIGDVAGAFGKYALPAAATGGAGIIPQALAFGATDLIGELGRQTVSGQPIEPMNLAKEGLKGAGIGATFGVAGAAKIAGRPFATEAAQAGIRGAGALVTGAAAGEPLKENAQNAATLALLPTIFNASGLVKTAVGRGILKEAKRVLKESGIPEYKYRDAFNNPEALDRWDAVSKSRYFKNIVDDWMKARAVKGKVPGQQGALTNEQRMLPPAQGFTMREPGSQPLIEDKGADLRAMDKTFVDQQAGAARGGVDVEFSRGDARRITREIANLDRTRQAFEQGQDLPDAPAAKWSDLPAREQAPLTQPLMGRESGITQRTVQGKQAPVQVTGSGIVRPARTITIDEGRVTGTIDADTIDNVAREVAEGRMSQQKGIQELERAIEHETKFTVEQSKTIAEATGIEATNPQELADTLAAKVIVGTMPKEQAIAIAKQAESVVKTPEIPQIQQEKGVSSVEQGAERAVLAEKQGEPERKKTGIYEMPPETSRKLVALMRKNLINTIDAMEYSNIIEGRKLPHFRDATIKRVDDLYEKRIGKFEKASTQKAVEGGKEGITPPKTPPPSAATTPVIAQKPTITPKPLSTPTPKGIEAKTDSLEAEAQRGLRGPGAAAPNAEPTGTVPLTKMPSQITVRDESGVKRTIVPEDGEQFYPDKIDAKKLSPQEYVKKKIGDFDGELVMGSGLGTIEIHTINLQEKGTGLGTKIINALKEYADILGKRIVVGKPYNKSFWDKQGFIERNDGSMKYDPIFRKGESGFISTDPITFDMLKERLKETKGDIKKSLTHLEEMGKKAWSEGKQSFAPWQLRMKAILGELWDGFKAHMSNVFGRVKKWWLDQGKMGIVAPGFETPGRKTKLNKYRDIQKKVVEQKFREDKLDLTPEEQAQVKARLEAIGLSKREVRTFAEIEEAAQELGTDVYTLLKSSLDNQIKPEEVVALRNIISTNKQFISDRATKLKEAKTTQEKSEIEMEIDRAEMQIDAALDKLVRGGTEAGRTVASFRIQGNATLNPEYWYRKAKKMLGARKFTTEMQTAIDELTKDKNINGLANFVSMLRKASLAEKAVTLWKANLLTSPTTHMANILGNTGMAFMESLKDLPAAGVDSLVSLATGKRTVVFSPKAISQKVKALPKAGRKAGTFFKTGIYPSDIANKWDVKKVNFDNKILQTYVDSIFRSLGAEDIIFREMAMQESFVKQAILEAKNAKLKGQEYKDKVAELLSTPTNGMVLNAIEAADIATYQNESAIAKLISAGKEAARNVGKEGSTARAAGEAVALLADVAAPFVKTPANIAARTMEYSPLGLIKAAYSAATGDQKGFSESFGRATTGTGLFLGLGAFLAAAGLMVGAAPDDKKEREMFYAEGKKPNSIKAFGKWWSLDRIQPLGILMGVGADIAIGMKKEKPDTVSQIFFKSAKKLSEMPFLMGVSGMLKAVQEPEEGAPRYVEQFAGSVVPTVVGRVGRTIDPRLVETRGIKEKVQEKIPGLRGGLPQKYDILGRPVESPSGRAALVDPFNVTTAKPDPVITEARRVGTAIGMPSKKLYETELTGREYSDYSKFMGEKMKEHLDDLIQSSEYQEISDIDKKAAFERRVRDVHSAVNKAVYGSVIQERYGIETTPDVMEYVNVRVKSPEFMKLSPNEQRQDLQEYVRFIEGKMGLPVATP